MPVSAATAAPRPTPLGRAYQAMARDAGLGLVSLVAVGLVYRATLVDAPLAVGAVVAVATAAHMHARLAMGRWRAALLVGATAGLLGLVAAPPRLIAGLLAGGLAGSALIARCTRRSEVLQAGVLAGVTTAVALMAAAVVLERPLGGGVAREGLLAVAGGVLAAPILQTLGPPLEWVFRHTTRLTMSEWLSFEHPLLRALATEAPGTFQHSINVGVLAASGASAIEADALLAHVAGLYHDVGKINAPGFFIENQYGPGPNPHDTLPPWESAKILRAHVLDGVALVGAHGMGDRVADIVGQHHGTSPMRLQREKAEAMAGAEDADESYQYPGPRPRSREAAVVMMADQLDATARSAPPADEAACRAIVERTFGRLQDEAQLAHAGLSERDLERLRSTFTKALTAMYHRRLTYPSSGTEAPPAPRSPFVPRLFSRRGPR